MLLEILIKRLVLVKGFEAWNWDETLYAHCLYKIVLNNSSCGLANNILWTTFSSLDASSYVQKVKYINWNFFQRFQDAPAQLAKTIFFHPEQWWMISSLVSLTLTERKKCFTFELALFIELWSEEKDLF